MSHKFVPAYREYTCDRCGSIEKIEAPVHSGTHEHPITWGILRFLFRHRYDPSTVDNWDRDHNFCETCSLKFSRLLNNFVRKDDDA